ncbi:MAG TPA: stalk domain-containing protein [Candidatus Tumulicola sp.]
MRRVTSFGIRSLLLFLALAAVGIPAVAAGVSVYVDGQPLYLSPGPIERAGRVFVPLRGIFERLGASVVYENREINSTKGDISVSLRIGSREATVNGQPQMVDVAPFIVGATTYVPLRFIAQSLGAVVDYNGAMRRVSITTPRQPMPPNPNPPPPPPAPYPPPYYVEVGARQPSPGGQFGDRFAPIGAQFSQPVDAGSVRVWLDNNDITSRSNVTRSGFSYRPPAPLYVGRHTVRVDGVDYQGRRFENTWSFVTTQGAPPANSVQLREQRPSPGSTIDDRSARISATFSPAADRNSVRVRLDGRDVTSSSGVTWNDFSYKPSQLDFGTHTVQVNGRGQSGVPFDRSWSFTIRRTASETPVELRNQQPGPGSTIENRFPQIAANFVPQADGASVRVRLDGNDITSRSGVSPDGFSYKPPAPLEFGTHTIQLNGRGRGGLGFERSWSFTVRKGEPTPISLNINEPGEGSVVGRSFTVQGSTAPNGRINVTAGASQSGTGQFDGNTTAGPKGNFHIAVSLSQLLGQQTVTVKITATDPATSQTARKSLQLRLRNAAPEPTVAPTTKPLPTPPPRPTSPPIARPTPMPMPIPTMAPLPAPTMRPRPIPPVVAPPAIATAPPTAAPTPTPAPPAARNRASRAAPVPSPTATPT